MIVQNIANTEDATRTAISRMVNFALEEKYSNVGFRIAYFLWVMRGANDLESLEYYSPHVREYSDDDYHLRGALGPRIRNWVGADQLEEAIKVNQDVDEPEQFVKPQGIDQLKVVYDDLNSESMVASTMVMRDPAIDFDETNDIPNLISATFTVGERVVVGWLNYEAIEYGSNYVNEIWTFLQILAMYKSWLLKEMGTLFVSAPICLNELNVDFVVNEFQQDFKEVKRKDVYHPNPNVVFTDLEHLQKFEMHCRCMLTGEAFNNPDVAISRLHELLQKHTLDKIQTQFLKEMGQVLLVFATVKYDVALYEDFIMETFNGLQSGLKYELALHLAKKQGLSLANQDEIAKFV